ncbi:hypothetical protein ACLKA7_004692 [Drosophila subpalustris]
MERRRSLCFTHSEGEDEDHLKRISMCFSIDVSERVKKQNRFHSQVSATERDSRAPGGGLFGGVEDRRPQRSYMSFTVPNKFYADSRDDKIYNPPRYEAREERPRRKQKYDHQIFREPIPEFVFKKKREKFFEENFDLYNCEFPTKFNHEFEEPTRNSHRRKSGYSGRDFETNPGIDYYNNQPVRRKSVDFFAHDCEIPYNILKRPRGNRYAESPSCLRFSSVDIPYKRKRRRQSFEYSYETDQRTESGSDICRPKRRCIDENIPRSYKSPAKTRAFNPLTRSSQRIWNQGTEVCGTKSRKSLKEKISGFFRRSKCKSRTKCCRYPRGLSLKGRRSPSRTCLDNSKSLSSISCAVVQSKRRIKSRAKCIAYPTVYRDKCPSCCPDPDDPEQDEHELATKCAASSGLPQAKSKAKLTVEAPSYGSFATEEPCSLICDSLTQKMPRTVGHFTAAKVKCSGSWSSCSSCSTENRSLQKPCCSPSVSQENLLPGKIGSQVCGAQTDNPVENIARQTVCNSPPPPPPPPPPSCCCSARVHDLLLHQIKQSTINVCLKICAADGNLLEPAIITASLEPSQPSCAIQSPESTSCLSDTRTVCSENNYANVRSVSSRNPSSTSCRAQKALRPILSTARKRSSTCCTPHKEKSRETVDWDKCPTRVKISQKGCKKKASSCKCQIEDPAIDKDSDGSDSSRLQLQNPCKKSSAKVEFACCPSSPPPPPPPSPPPSPPLECECPKECNDRPSFLEQLKRELLERLRSEQRLDCQLPYQKPTPHISIFPCAQEDACPNPSQSSPNPCNTCWTPL